MFVLGLWPCARMAERVFRSDVRSKFRQLLLALSGKRQRRLWTRWRDLSDLERRRLRRPYCILSLGLDFNEWLLNKEWWHGSVVFVPVWGWPFEDVLVKLVEHQREVFFERFLLWLFDVPDNQVRRRSDGFYRCSKTGQRPSLHTLPFRLAFNYDLARWVQQTAKLL
jgi:hypothetical protein